VLAASAHQILGSRLGGEQQVLQACPARMLDAPPLLDSLIMSMNRPKWQADAGAQTSRH
jgi:hypothetical protein